MKEKTSYSLYNNYFGENYIYSYRHREFDKKIKTIAEVNHNRQEIHIIDKNYYNKSFISWLLNKHANYKIKEAQ